ncbi:MAG: 5'-3' exonuclease H3TH domain-containing protein [Victivallaceae bacterium]|nr:5'-3' exonuclease H3TH domain-containing protein [Victivallaceae bacterium]
MSLVAVDAYSQIFRGFYAIMGLSDSRGEPTNAIFSFAKLLLYLDKNQPSSHGGMAFDCGKVAFRLAIAPDYKGNREPTPEPLLRQIPFIRELAEDFGWPVMEDAALEADDLIAGAVELFRGDQVRIVSSDKDLAQLVSPSVSLLRPAKPSGFNEWNCAAVAEGFGVTPLQMVDYLSLLGDASDNIPGVRGVGGKTAAKILAEIGSLDAFFADPSVLSSAKLRGVLTENRGILEKNRSLIRLRAELPAMLASRGKWVRRAPDWAAIRSFCEKFELKSLLRELPAPEEKITRDLFDF